MTGAHPCSLGLAAAVMAACSGLPTRADDASIATDAADGVAEPPRPAPRITQLATGGRHVCALDDAGDVWCWGSNLRGEAAPDLAEIAVLRPRRVAGVRATQIAVGPELSCVLRPEGTVQCWGRNEAGQVVPAQRSPTAPPTNVTARNAARVVAGGDLAFAIQRDGSLWAWGDALLAATPRDLEVTMVREARAGARHACAVRVDGSARCVGAQVPWILGATPSNRGIATPPVAAARDVVAGIDFTCVLDDAGAVWCWGANHAGQLGRGTFSPSGEVARVDGIDDAQALAAGGSTLFVRRPTGWIALGDNRFGVFQRAAPTRAATPVNALRDLPAEVSALAVGEGHACALLAEGRVACWGSNVYGALGRGSLGGFAVSPESPRW